MTALIQRSGIPREYTVTRAGPQNHDSVGSVERGVREVKEGIATIRLELAKENCDLQDSLAGWEACARYVVAMHNLHGKVENTGKTGREVLRDSVEASRVSAMFCSHVLAETPESVPSVGRFVGAGYLYPVRNSFSHFVVAKIEDDLKYFQARSLKFVFPITYPMDFSGGPVLNRLEAQSKTNLQWRSSLRTLQSCRIAFHLPVIGWTSLATRMTALPAQPAKASTLL